MADKRTPDQIEQDLEATRQRLAENLSQLVTEVHPKAVVHRTIEDSKRELQRGIRDAKALVRISVEKTKRVFKDDSGWKVKSLAVAGAVMAGIVTVAVVTRKHSHG